MANKTKKAVASRANDLDGLHVEHLARQSIGTDEFDMTHQIGKLTRAIEGQKSDIVKRNGELESENWCLKKALDHMKIGISMIDPSHELVLCNEIYAKLYQLPEYLTRPGTHLAEIALYYAKQREQRSVDAEGCRAWVRSLSERLQKGEDIAEIRELDDGRVIRATFRPLEDGGWLDLQEDITENVRAERKIEWMTRNDSLTGLNNRSALFEQLEVMFENFDPKYGFAFHWIDIRGFKKINDQHGQIVGDQLLKKVAARLKTGVRQGDFLARLGGDEFAVLQMDVDCAERVAEYAGHFQKLLSKTYRFGGYKFNVKSCIGAALAPAHGLDKNQLMGKADLALRCAKKSSKGSCTVFEPSMEVLKGKANPLANELSKASERQELVLHYHPIVDIKAGEVASFEALMRWNHPQNGIMAPAEFMTVAEETGLIVEMGSWALMQACTDAKKWPAPVKVSVNISPVQLEDSDIVETVRQALAKTELKPERLQLEITETLLLQDQDMVRKILLRLKQLGVSLALDDFGTCFASLSYLRDFPFDKIKIDRSFVQVLPENAECEVIVRNVASLAESLGMASVAEGVETSENLDSVTAAGCDEAQGYYFSTPVPARALEDVIEKCSSRMKAVAR